jgi:hypothetical protein
LCSICENMHVNVAFSTYLITPKMLAPCGLNFHFYIFFHGPCVEKIVNINTKTKKKLKNFLSTCTPIKHHNNTLSMENLNPKCDKTNIRNAKFSNFTMKMRPKLKKIPCKLYPFNIDVYFQHQNTSCTLLHCLHYPSLKNLDFLKQYN